MRKQSHPEPNEHAMDRKIQRLFFYFSLIILSCFYGITATGLGWFPAGVVERAMIQANQLFAPPDFVETRAYRKVGLQLMLWF